MLMTGEFAGGIAIAQLPHVPCTMAKVKAEYDNAGRVYIGGPGVAKRSGITNPAAGWELSAGEESPWMLIHDLAEVYRICDNAGDDLIWMVVQ